MRPDAPASDWGRPSAAAGAPWKLRATGRAEEAAYRADGGDGRRWSVRAASVSGTAHRLQGSGPEDAYGWAASDGRLVVSVADGVGSRPGGAEASRAAVAAANASAQVWLDDPKPRSPLEAAVAALTAANVRLAAGEGATTLVVACAGEDAHVGVARVGDSSGFLLDGDTWTELWTAEPDADDVISTRTAALPATEPATEPEIEGVEVVLSADTALVLLTDGLANPLRDGPTTVAPSLAAAVAARPAPFSLLGAADFSRQGCLDDRTIVAVWQNSPT